LAIEIDTLKSERDRLKDSLREIEVEQRKLEASIKGLRQQELKVKREIEALTTLIELADGRPEKGE
jgi:predicted  nucleic acid-binding Zn-ribbon protein